MSNYKNILVAIDIHADYEFVIKKALTICKSPEDIRLIFIPLPTVYLQPYLYGMENNVIDEEELIKRDHKKLKDIAKKFGIAQKHVHLKAGYAADEIKLFANDTDVDLIVLGTHGRSGIKLLLGSTANSVLHGVKQDVLAVRIND